MKLEKWALVAEIFAGLAVVVSLIVVAFELNQNTEQARLETTALQNSTYQDLITNVLDLNGLVVQDPEFAEILNRAETDPAELSSTDVRRLSSYAISTFRHGDMAYFLYMQGTIDQERLDSLLSIVVSRIDSGPPSSQVWDQFKEAGIFSRAYVAYVEDLRESTNYSGGINRVLSEQ